MCLKLFGLCFPFMQEKTLVENRTEQVNKFKHTVIANKNLSAKIEVKEGKSREDLII